MKIDPRHLSVMLAVVRAGSFNRAAEALGISQPALSKSIGLLERRLGVKVFERGARGSALTAIGQIVALRAENLDQLLTRMYEEIRLAKAHRKGPLVIGATPSMMIGLVPEALARLIRAHPTINVTLLEDLDDRLTPKLASGEIDLLVGPVMGLHPVPSEFVETRLADDEYYAVLARNHPKAKAATLRIAELADERWLLPSPGSSFYRGVEAIFTAAGIPWPQNLVTNSSVQSHRRLISHTGCVGIATKVQLLTTDKLVRAIPLADIPPRTIGVKQRAGQSQPPMVGEFLLHLRKALVDLKMTTSRPRVPAAIVGSDDQPD